MATRQSNIELLRLIAMVMVLALHANGAAGPFVSRCEATGGSVEFIRNADMLIVGGTSLTVYPAASLVRYYSGGYLIIVNRDATGQEEWADLTFHESIGEVFSHITV